MWQLTRGADLLLFRYFRWRRQPKRPRWLEQLAGQIFDAQFSFKSASKVEHSPKPRASSNRYSARTSAMAARHLGGALLRKRGITATRTAEIGRASCRERVED